MYSSIIDTFPDSNNPIRFYYYNGKMKPLTGYAERNIIDPNIGDTVLKLTIKCIFKNHDGYCSSFDFYDYKDEIIHSNEQIKQLYINLPTEFLDEETQNIRSDILDDDSNIIENEISEILFKEWNGHSDCNGSGCCHLYDTFIPIKIEYVKIT